MVWPAVGAALALVAIAAGMIVVTRRRRAAHVNRSPIGPPSPPHIRPAVDPTRLEPVITKPPDPSQPLSFTVVRGAKPGQRFAGTVTSTRSLVAGRAAQCDIVLHQDPGILDRQFEVRYETPAGVIVIDLAGGGQTQKNGVPIHARAKLEDGDIIGAGSTEMRVRFGTS
jgi:pSer/pThr/pTyr-binding forkhead associated (FHA) protein